MVATKNKNLIKGTQVWSFKTKVVQTFSSILSALLIAGLSKSVLDVANG